MRAVAGVEVSTGPLGQGLSNAVGLALSEAHLAATFNKEGHNIIDHHTFVICGDGCLQEGVTSEACRSVPFYHPQARAALARWRSRR